MDRQRISGVLWGVVLILLGVSFAGTVLGFWDFNIFFRGWWTLFIIIPCSISIVKSGLQISSLIGLLIGVFLFVASWNLIDFGTVVKLIVPAILIIIGLKFIFRDSWNKTAAAIKKINQSGNGDFSAVFGEQNADFTGQVFNGADTNAIFGSVNLNLRNAVITEDIVINATSIFGGVSIYVPNNVKVKVSSTPIFGGVSNKAVPTIIENAPTLYVNATCMFGGVDIK